MSLTIDSAFVRILSAMVNTVLVAGKTVVNAKGDGPVVDVSTAANRVFLLTLDITNIIEQESLELSIFVSTDGVAWDAKPLVSYPQQFYRGQFPLLLDLSNRSEAKFVRAHWDVARWGRGAETPMFEFGLHMKEIPPDILREAGAETKAFA